MNNQVKAHEEAVALFKKEANSGKNENFKAYASKMLPTLEAHLKMARAIADKLGTAK
jgi:putative membrane protein